MNAAIAERRPAIEVISGLIERVTFHKDENGSCVLGAAIGTGVGAISSFFSWMVETKSGLVGAGYPKPAAQSLRHVLGERGAAPPHGLTQKFLVVFFEFR